MVLRPKGVVLVGGLGPRMRPLTLSAPMPMLPPAGVPFLPEAFVPGSADLVRGRLPSPELPGPVGAVLLPGATVHVDAQVGVGSVVGAGCELREGLRIWPGVMLSDGGLRFSADV